MRLPLLGKSLAPPFPEFPKLTLVSLCFPRNFIAWTNRWSQNQLHVSPESSWRTARSKKVCLFSLSPKVSNQKLANPNRVSNPTDISRSPNGNVPTEPPAFWRRTPELGARELRGSPLAVWPLGPGILESGRGPRQRSLIKCFVRCVPKDTALHRSFATEMRIAGLSFPLLLPSRAETRPKVAISMGYLICSIGHLAMNLYKESGWWTAYMMSTKVWAGSGLRVG